MLATTMRHVTHAVPEDPQPAARLGLLAAGKAGHGSRASTRAGSPCSSSSSSDDCGAGFAARGKSQTSGTSSHDSAALAERRGRNVLMLSELIDVDSEACWGSPSANSSVSSMGTGGGNSTLCTPCTTHMMSFSPTTDGVVSGAHASEQCPLAAAKSSQPSQAAGLFTNQVADKSMMGTNPAQRFTDASQRSPVGGSRFGAAAAGGDASQRSPVPRLSLGTAVIGGDASQRSPPCFTNHRGEQSFAHLRCSPAQGLQTPCTSWTEDLDRGLLATPCKDRDEVPQTAEPPTTPPATMQGGHHATSAVSSLSSLPADGGSDALKSWLFGPMASNTSFSDMDLVERLRAAAPESYED